ncbi:MAG: hypothetical protein ACJAUP_002565 [Cellvibrionaceae bacterium]|jgi:uncharacterized protein (DUF3820 family)
MNELETISIITPENLQALVQEAMPFGKYQSTLIADLPEEYLLWFNKQGFPKGRLGELLQLSLLLHIDGSQKILDPLRRPQQAPKPKTSAIIKFD